jgi:ABC-type phosphate transport system substrate-binding protein
MRSRLFMLRLLLLCLLLLPGFSQAAEEVIAVIVAPGHGKALKKDDLALIFKRKKMFWGEGGKIQPVNLPASNPLRRAFSQAALGATPEELEKYWNDMYFHGVSPPFVLGSEEAVLRFVAETPGAVGYVPLCSADSRVAVALVISAGGHVSEDTSSISCPR